MMMTTPGLCVRYLVVTVVFCIAVTGQHGTYEAVDTSGRPVPLHSVGGCVTHPVDMDCPSGRVAPVRYSFVFKSPAVQKSAGCSSHCSPPSFYQELENDETRREQYFHKRQHDLKAIFNPVNTPCPTECCHGDAERDCRVDTRPTFSLQYRVRKCSRLSSCLQQPLARTVLRSRDNVTCPHFQKRETSIVSQMATLHYMCVQAQWEVDLLRYNRKTGAALFVTSPEVLDQGLMAYNTTCTITALTPGAVLEFRVLDLRTCHRSQYNTGLCGLHLRIRDGGRHAWTSDKDAFYSSPGQWLGFKYLYTSSSSHVTLELESLRPLAHVYSIWLYVRPDQGLVMVECRDPTFFPPPPARLMLDGPDIESLVFAVCMAVLCFTTLVMAYFCKASSTQWAKTRAAILRPFQRCRKRIDSV